MYYEKNETLVEYILRTRQRTYHTDQKSVHRRTADNFKSDILLSFKSVIYYYKKAGMTEAAANTEKVLKMLRIVWKTGTPNDNKK